MKKCIFLIFCLLAGCVSVCVGQNADCEGRFEPTSTHLFAERDSVSLYLDIYEPDVNGRFCTNPDSAITVMFAFGGGFKNGARDETCYTGWYRMLTQCGYRVIAIDYRLGLKGVKATGLKFVEAARYAINIAADDMIAATAYVLEHASELHVRTDKIVVSGSSAGAIAALQAEWKLCNGRASLLPSGFNYAGVMSFAGAILSDEGSIMYKQMEPCPHFMCHGTADRIVKYGKIKIFNINYAGTPVIAKTFIKNGYVYRILRFEGNSHEIAGEMVHLINETIDFLETNVRRGSRLSSDALIKDPDIKIPDWARGSTRSLYSYITSVRPSASFPCFEALACPIHQKRLIADAHAFWEMGNGDGPTFPTF